METETDGDDGKKVDAIKHPEPAMVADDVLKEDGAEAVPEGVKDAAAHAPAAEAVPKLAQTELPEEVEPEDWKIVEGRPKRGSWLQKVALMVKGTDEKTAVRFAGWLLRKRNVRKDKVAAQRSQQR